MDRPVKKKILFLSGDDFKEKSIQVIRKTPEAYARQGWEVHYVVGRDTSPNGDYFYEPVINPPDIIVYRFLVPFAKIQGLSNSTLWKAVWSRIRKIFLVFRLAIQGIKLIRKHRFDIIYGYEIPGTLATRIVRMLGFRRESKFVTRFQGVLFVKEWLRKGHRFRRLSNIDAILALRTQSDLCIMTNDGSQGLRILKELNSPVKNIAFFVNGVDPVNLDKAILQQVRSTYYSDSISWYLLSVSRLDNHKRIDRSIRIVSALVHNYKFHDLKFTVIGGGVELENLMELTRKLRLEDYVRFLGPVKHEYVKYHLYLSHLFLSMYTSTNVGNPLLESIRYNKPVITLANGDTGEWITHWDNGLIYPVDDDSDLSEEDYKKIASDILILMRDRQKQDEMLDALKRTENLKLWSWEERLEAELRAVNELLTNT